ncbi:2-oxoglutarate and iron-dependent oxygenase domain-containing protein [Streptomyces sp. NPDC006463]|uniref:2-oxoglutarate and iron-dependent oxygenase domain-containing protein n=1 Tax=Streptomyces sp. NPDC006463 TaxID=3364746 RepID=UPI0036B77A68
MSGLATFQVPDQVTGTAADEALGRAMTAAWQRDGIFQVAAGAGQRARTREAMAASRRFFARPLAEKAACVKRHLVQGVAPR